MAAIDRTTALYRIHLDAKTIQCNEFTDAYTFSDYLNAMGNRINVMRGMVEQGSIAKAQSLLSETLAIGLLCAERLGIPDPLDPLKGEDPDKKIEIPNVVRFHNVQTNQHYLLEDGTKVRIYMVTVERGKNEEIVSVAVRWIDDDLMNQGGCKGQPLETFPLRPVQS